MIKSSAVAVVVCVLNLLPVGSRDRLSAAETVASAAAARKEAAHRQRRLIFDNDGDEPIALMKSVDPQELLNARTSSLEDSQVDTIFYSTGGCFGTSNRPSKAWKLYSMKADPHLNNQLGPLADAGIDPLQVMVDFGKQNDIEVFSSIRMNDTHDAGRTGYSLARFEFNDFKNQHPEFLLGTPTQLPQHGAFSAVDYSHPEVRESMYQYIVEAMENYDVAGVHLDFFRHPVFFRSTAQGKVVTKKERDQMSELLQRLRGEADRIGEKRGRPVLISVRVPDSAEYCHDIGLDLRRWLQDDLVDLLVVASYFQLNDWDASVALGKEFNVPVYPSLDEIRVKDDEAKKARMEVKSYRGRAAVAWDSGVDGICMFNLFNPRSPLWRELGDPGELKKLDRDYFASPRGVVNAAGGNLPLDKYLHLETLNPRNPKPVSFRKETTSSLVLGDRFVVNPGDQFSLRLKFAPPAEAKNTQVRLNGEVLKMSRNDLGELQCDSVGGLLRGENRVGVQLRSAGQPLQWTDLLLEVRATKD